MQYGGDDTYYDAPTSVDDSLNTCQDLMAMLQRVQCDQVQKSVMQSMIEEIHQVLVESKKTQQKELRSRTARYLTGSSQGPSCLRWDAERVKETVTESIDQWAADMEQSAQTRIASAVMAQVRNAAMYYLAPYLVDSLRRALLGS